ncbi:polycomb protein Su(z)12 isoform X2 [Teleopsis dalmanni]|uniref:polycomb protein Su(z)12 isoform X2 n=1 Tax=Teleopsis dalmanni TaxID=139649 RepID=UPI0018CE8817|nr:polycomb protein Su(z)12 isoform X2 [Teleopsis dalmanni]
MPPSKRRERDSNCNAGGGLTVSNTSEETKLNSRQQEQELFIQAFEKPTQIYRFLRSRHATSPIFLNRTLIYMKDRMSRNHKNRQTFKVNSILETKARKTEPSNNFLNIVMKGIFDERSGIEQLFDDGEEICVECNLCKITRSKRKDSTSDFQEILSQATMVVCNPHNNIGKYSTICIPGNLMQPLSDHALYKLSFRINGLSSVDIENKNSEQEEISSKRRKVLKTLGAEIIIIEKNTVRIPEADYECILQDIKYDNHKLFSPKKRVWETLPENFKTVQSEITVFKNIPCIKFRLLWASMKLPAIIDQEEFNSIARFTQVIENGGNFELGNEHKNGVLKDSEINHNNNCIKNGNTNATEKIQIVYNFLYSNNTRQQTEYTEAVNCPWCDINCLRLSSLVNHLKYSHARFNFACQGVGNGARIDVTINDSYDGSYAGSPHDLAGPSGCSFARTCGPVRRSSVTQLLVYRPRRQKTLMNDILYIDEDDVTNPRAYISGHNRLYHHTETCLPVHRKELDEDSEQENDPLWLQQKTIQMIDEFSDVNEGEKELMKLWNLHVMKHGYVGDCQLPIACEMFLNDYCQEIIKKNLYRNFTLHLCTLFDYGLISPETLYKTMQKLQSMVSKYEPGRSMMSNQRKTQLKYWQEVGKSKQDEQNLKTIQKQNLANPPATKKEISGNNLDSKVMQPPVKRTPTNARRSNVLTNNPINPPDVYSSSNSKSVAKKSVLQDDDVFPSTSREKRKTDLLRNTAGDTQKINKIKTENGAPTQGVKRRLSNKAADDDFNDEKRQKECDDIKISLPTNAMESVIQEKFELINSLQEAALND